MVELPRCVDCTMLAPQTTTAHTLISAQHSWRLIRREVSGKRVLEWRCPDCWRRFKESQLASGDGPARYG